jgi:hypothetical protein
MGRAAQAYYAEHFEPAMLAQRLVERFGAAARRWKA